jgi:hypothetical protein
MKFSLFTLIFICFTIIFNHFLKNTIYNTFTGWYDGWGWILIYIKSDQAPDCSTISLEKSEVDFVRVAISFRPFKPPVNFLVINYYSGECIGDYLRMSDNLKHNLGGFWHFPIGFREYYCRFNAWQQNLSVKTKKFQVKIVKNRNLFFELSCEKAIFPSTRNWCVGDFSKIYSLRHLLNILITILKARQRVCVCDFFFLIPSEFVLHLKASYSRFSFEIRR